MKTPKRILRTVLSSANRRFWLKKFGLAALLPFASGRSYASAPKAPDGDGFTLVILPDTQMYAWKDPSIYRAQTQWIADNIAEHKIPMVLHVGDVTQHNNAEQWQAAREAHDLIAEKVPCLLLPGNHDLGPEGNASTRQTLMSEYFPPTDFERWSTFGGFYDREPQRTENSFHTLEAGGRKWLVLALEFGPRDDVLRWAGEVVQKHPDRSVILVTHAYLRTDNTRFDRHATFTSKGKESNKGLDNFKLSGFSEGFNDGEDVWKKLVSQHPNFVLVISGHTCVTGRRIDTGKHGNTVHQMVVDYQNQENGGNGFLRLLQFPPEGKTIRVVDYSPYLDQNSEIKNTDFEIDLPPQPRPV
ncbi:MAG: metallophosphoesterase [Pirellulaceae bacterium]|nr:metallophosphoesterase [Pirellulaceae bacterium]